MSLHVALDFQEAEGELRERVIDPAEIPAPQSMEEFFEKEWIRSLFTLAIEDLRKRCAERQREKTFSDVRGIRSGWRRGHLI